MFRILLALSAVVFAAACTDRTAPAASGSDSSTASARSGTARTARPAPKGENAPYEIDGDVVRVNNRICAVSRTPMGEETLGQFVSRVQYDGPDPRFAGKTLEFNQCCPMCLDQFAQIWAERRDEVLHFHGLLAQS